MPVSSQHPRYSEMLPLWLKCQDVYDGEDTIKSKGSRYLPPTSGMLADGAASGNAMAPGKLAYDAYVTRSVFPNSVADAVEILLGMMHHKPADVQLPPQMEPLFESVSNHGETLQMFLRKINERQLISGRVGLMVDLPAEPVNGLILPYLVLYEETDILNWDCASRLHPLHHTIHMVVLEESGWFREPGDFEWERKEKYRVLKIDGGMEGGIENTYQADVYEDLNTFTTVTPSLRGKTLDEIPFVFINSKDVLAEPDNPPLLGLANLALAIYRGEADLRQALFMQGQDTLVVIGGKETDVYRVGANSHIAVPIGGDAKYIGVSSDGLTEMRKTLENDKKISAHRGAQLTDTTSRQKESGDALKTRVGAQTATLNQIALAGAEGLQQALRLVAKWMGLDAQQVKVTPNLDFADDTMAGKDMVDMMTAKAMGFPIALESLHRVAQKFGLTQLSFEEEQEKIEGEPPVGTGTQAGGNPPAATSTIPSTSVTEPNAEDDDESDEE